MISRRPRKKGNIRWIAAILLFAAGLGVSFIPGAGPALSAILVGVAGEVMPVPVPIPASAPPPSADASPGPEVDSGAH